MDNLKKDSIISSKSFRGFLAAAGVKYYDPKALEVVTDENNNKMHHPTNYLAYIRNWCDGTYNPVVEIMENKFSEFHEEITNSVNEANFGPRTVNSKIPENNKMNRKFTKKNSLKPFFNQKKEKAQGF